VKCKKISIFGEIIPQNGFNFIVEAKNYLENNVHIIEQHRWFEKSKEK